MSIRQDRPHLRCGICDEEFAPHADTVYVDDERCHRACVNGDVTAFELDCALDRLEQIADMPRWTLRRYIRERSN